MKDKLKFLGILAISVLISFSLGYSLKTTFQHKTPKASVNVFIFHESTNGIAVIPVGNLITDIGETFIRDSVSGPDAQSITDYISLSNDATPLVSWTKLPNEVNANGFARAQGAVTNWTYSGDAAYNVTHKFTATDAQTLQCAGLNWASTPESDNNLFAAAAFTQTAFTSGDNCTIVWMIVFDAN